MNFPNSMRFRLVLRKLYNSFESLSFILLILFLIFPLCQDYSSVGSYWIFFFINLILCNRWGVFSLLKYPQSVYCCSVRLCYVVLQQAREMGLEKGALICK